MLLEIVTRHIPTRPTMLRRNQDSVLALGDQVKHTLLVDDVGRGVGWANAQLAGFEPVGDYVWLLDDDDEAVDTTLTRWLAEAAREQAPDLVILRMDHGPTAGILPDAFAWKKRPVMGQFGCSSFITSAGHWRRCRSAWHNNYAADADFVRHAFDMTTAVVWHDVLASRCQRGANHGGPE